MENYRDCLARIQLCAILKAVRNEGSLGKFKDGILVIRKTFNLLHY
jgi:hypothetical protein